MNTGQRIGIVYSAHLDAQTEVIDDNVPDVVLVVEKKIEKKIESQEKASRTQASKSVGLAR